MLSSLTMGEGMEGMSYYIWKDFSSVKYIQGHSYDTFLRTC